MNDGLPRALGGLALAAVVIAGLAVVGGPIVSNDFWWHLALGEQYAAHGPQLAVDPFVFTAHGQMPDPHAWLFGSTLYAVESLGGLAGVRVLHGVAVAAIVGLAFGSFRRAAQSDLAACLACSVFLVLSWWRLMQLRPDLFSIAAVLVVHRLVLDPTRPLTIARISAFAVLMAVWSNMHALFAIGPALVLAALVGLLAQMLLATRAGEAGSAQAGVIRQRAIWTGVALAAGAAAGLLNPKGVGQYASFFSASETSALWRIGDEWRGFDPFFWTHDRGGMSHLTWVTADALLVLFFVSAAFAGVAAIRGWNRRRVPPTDGVGLALGAASVVAIGVSGRFLFLLFFALLFVAHSIRTRRTTPSRRRRERWAAAGAATAMSVALPVVGDMRTAIGELPRDRESRIAHWTRDYDGCLYHVDGVRFLRDVGAEGRLFDPYWMGGFFAYWLAPALQTFVDGRLNFPDEIFDEYFAVTYMRRLGGQEVYLATLERREIDWFFGVGYPTPAPDERRRIYTTTHLEGVPGWVLVSRSLDHAVYLRRHPRNRENLERVADYYRREGIAFDPAIGFEPGTVIREHPDWAERNGLLPRGYQELRATARVDDPEVRATALGALGRIHLLAGDYEAQVDFDRRAGRWLAASAPYRRLVVGLLRLGRNGEAIEAAATLETLAEDPSVSELFLRAARDAPPPRPGPERLEQRAVLQRLPVVSRLEVEALHPRLDCSPLAGVER